MSALQSTGARVAAFAAGLALVFGVSWAAGAAVDPVASEPPAAHGEDHSSEDSGEAVEPTASDLPGGLAVAQDGYALELATPTLDAGTQDLTFRVLGPQGPVTAYDVEHDKELHLIAVRRDFSGFQHVHPTLTGDTWSTDLDLTPGAWRVFADFRPTGGPPLTLGADLTVPGASTPAVRTASRVDEVDGYTVALEGDLVAGEESEVRLVVSRDGEEVEALDPYLGAAGHLVALREGDLAYLHVHPTSSVGGSVGFLAEIPSDTTYHLYFDFQHDGVVRTAEFTVDASTGAAAPDQADGADGADGAEHTDGKETDDDHGH